MLSLFFYRAYKYIYVWYLMCLFIRLKKLLHLRKNCMHASSVHNNLSGIEMHKNCAFKVLTDKRPTAADTIIREMSHANRNHHI